MATESKIDADSYHFKAEIRQLLDILVHSLYKEREIFLRELISNASDALTRIQFEMLTNEGVLQPEADLAIHIDVVDDVDSKQLIIKDSGIGMSHDELVDNLGTIAQSGAREFLDTLKDGEANLDEIIGRFGVGFYSVFMVAEEVRVISRSYQPDAPAATWISSGTEEFSVAPANKQDRGTEIHIKLKKDAEEFANDWKLRQIVKKHSDFVGYPIYVGEEQANQQQSLWRKSPQEVSAEEYQNFYQQLTMDFEEPLVTVPLSSDAPLHVRAVLYVPTSREKSMLNLRKEPGLKLYSHNVLIQEYCLDLLPKWLNFVDGVVDSEDLPLNVSRETIQNNRMMRQLGKTLRSRLLKELNTLAEGSPEKYHVFWEQYGRVFKEGLASEPEVKDTILPFFRFYSSSSNADLVTLDDYIERMPEEQDEIYYVLGDDCQSVSFSPHLDPFKVRNMEVLYLVDPLDPFIAPLLTEYKSKKLRNIDDAALELPETEPEVVDEESTEGPDEADFNRLVGRCVTTLGERVLEEREAKVLRDSPVRLVAGDDQAGRDMQRIYRFLDQDFEVPKKIFEVNRSHPLIAHLAKLVTEKPEDEVINISIEQLYESALVLEGLHPNPANMLPRIQHLLELAVDRTVSESD